MAEAVISIAGSILLNLITEALQKEGKLGAVKHELKGLESTVSMLGTVLGDAEKRYHQSSQIKDWVEKLKEVFYDAQDVIEEVNIEAMRRELRGDNEMIKEVRTFFSSSNQLALALKMSRKIRAVRDRMVAISTEGPVDSPAEMEQGKRQETHSFIREEDIIGRDDDKKKVMEFLLDVNVKEGISILPIVGIGGLGKTALAQYVYNDKMISEHFNLKMWICVSNDFDVKKIVKKIITCGNEEPNYGAMEQLQRKLKEKIDGQRYFLVLDDLWISKQDTLLGLKHLLGGGAKGSKILITTRLPLVANITGNVPPHLLYGLSENASLDLLMQMACQKEEEMQDPDMLAIGQEIVRKCYGVPLVVRTVGRLLFRKKTKLEWSYFKDYELPQVPQRENQIISVLRLSYDHLPSHLKQCFAFCSLFPKDYEIKKWTLVNLWMAEGFIQPSNRGQHLEDIAHEYFMDLLRRNFFQEFQEDRETCKMQNLMHDLACSVAGTEYCAAWNDAKSIHGRTRHISHDSTSNLMGKLLISRLKASALRTFLSVTGYWEPTSEVDLCRLIQSFKRLRILDLHAANVKKVPRFICKLKHLTYLDLSKNDALKRLPNSITRLHNLQTLNLSDCGSLKELPRAMGKLVNLRNLNIDYCYELSYMPRGLGQLSSLHMLSCFILPDEKALAKKYCRLRELKNLNNIRGKLSIENLESVTDAVGESQAANLRGKCSLEVLVLSWGFFIIIDEAMITKRDEELLDGLRPPENLRKLIINRYNGESFPKWMTELPNLVELKLAGCTRCKQFPQLGLSKLKHLHIDGMKFLEHLPGVCVKSLTLLESLKIYDLPRLTSLPLGLRHLSKLVDLSIGDCEELDLSKDESGNIFDFHRDVQSLRSMSISKLPKLESLPQWILQLRNLERLVIWECRNLKDIPEQIEALQLLQYLDISGCSSLTSFPEAMRRLTSLTHLTIYRCGELKESCRRKEGKDWDNIAHIPNIQLD